jgi:hypothetical protein
MADPQDQRNLEKERVEVVRHEKKVADKERREAREAMGPLPPRPRSRIAAAAGAAITVARASRKFSSLNFHEALVHESTPASKSASSTSKPKKTNRKPKVNNEDVLTLEDVFSGKKEHIEVVTFEHVVVFMDHVCKSVLLCPKEDGKVAKYECSSDMPPALWASLVQSLPTVLDYVKRNSVLLKHRARARPQKISQLEHSVLFGGNAKAGEEAEGETAQGTKPLEGGDSRGGMADRAADRAADKPTALDQPAGGETKNDGPSSASSGGGNIAVMLVSDQTPFFHWKVHVADEGDKQVRYSTAVYYCSMLYSC